MISPLKKKETLSTVKYLLWDISGLFLPESSTWYLSAAEMNILAGDQVTVGYKYSAICLEGKDVKRDFKQVLCNVSKMWNAVLLLSKTCLAVPATIPIYEHADSKEAFHSLSNSVYSQKERKKKVFYNCLFSLTYEQGLKVVSSNHWDRWREGGQNWYRE